ncbi:hypothetical protein V8B97DRAFT_1913947 [Scleroderma yunnanense]
MKTYLAIWATHTTHQVSMQNPWKAVVTQKTQSQGWFIMGMPTVHTHTQVVQGGGGCHQHLRVVLVLVINAVMVVVMMVTSLTLVVGHPDDGEMVITLSMLVVVFNTGGHIISTDVVVLAIDVTLAGWWPLLSAQWWSLWLCDGSMKMLKLHTDLSCGWKPAENTALNVRVKTHLLLQVKPQRPTGQSHWVCIEGMSMLNFNKPFETLCGVITAVMLHYGHGWWL